MGMIELMAIGNPIPDMAVTVGSGVGLMLPLLALLGAAVCGIWMAFPPRSPGEGGPLAHAAGR